MLLCVARILLYLVLCIVPARSLIVQRHRQVDILHLGNGTDQRLEESLRVIGVLSRAIPAVHSNFPKATNFTTHNHSAEYSLCEVLWKRAKGKDVDVATLLVGIVAIVVIVFVLILMLKSNDDRHLQLVEDSSSEEEVDASLRVGTFGNVQRLQESGPKSWKFSKSISDRSKKKEGAGILKRPDSSDGGSMPAVSALQRSLQAGVDPGGTKALGKSKGGQISDSGEVSRDAADAKNAFPHSLGPFALQQTNWNAADLKVSNQQDGEKAWSIEKDAWRWLANKNLELFANFVEEWPITGRLGPLSSISTFPAIPEDSSALIPTGAHTFCWSPPLGDKFTKWSKCASTTSSPDVNFLLRGGFVFCDRNGTICGVQTIGAVTPQHSSLSFGAPRNWHPKRTSAMKDKFCKIAKGSKKIEAGALYYGWVGADEAAVSGQISEDEKLIAPLAPHGGFVYVFRDIAQGASSDDSFDQGGTQDIIFPLERVQPPQRPGTSGSSSRNGLRAKTDGTESSKGLLSFLPGFRRSPVSID